MKKLFYILFSILCASACGPDLSPDKYFVKSIVLNTYEEYSFQYASGKLIGIEGTDSVRLSYSYYKDSVSIKHTKTGRLFQTTRLTYSGGELAKVKIKWLFDKIWYKDSISFTYSGSNLNSFIYKKNNYQLAIQGENVTSIKRGVLGIGGSYGITYDQITNPFKSVYWLDQFLMPSGFTTTLQPKVIMRYFSKNNISTISTTILGITEVEKYSYIYLHGILPKFISVNVESGKTKYENVVFIFDIQYTNKSASGF